MLNGLPWRAGSRLISLVAASILGSHAAQAHDGTLDPRLIDWNWLLLDWNWDAWTLGATAWITLWYALGIRRLHREHGGHGIGIERAGWSFASGIAWLAVALISPLDAVSGALFSAHMVQHMLLLLVAAPPLVRSRTPLVLFWAFPPAARKSMARAWLATPAWRHTMRLLDLPLTVWALSASVLLLWHLPAPYGWAMRHPAVHAAEHVIFLVSAYGFWSIVLEPRARRRLDYGMTILFVGTIAAEGGLLGAILTFAPHPFYAAHIATAPALGLTALQDQQLAGLIMWIPASLIYMIAIGTLFRDWLRTADQRERALAMTR